jgi:hypothetical protein
MSREAVVGDRIREEKGRRPGWPSSLPQARQPIAPPSVQKITFLVIDDNPRNRIG